MSFTFLVEDGTGLAAATSYAALATANDYFLIDFANAAAWSALSDTVKQYQLSWATRILDQKTQWRGRKYVATSSLRWPRTGVYDRDGFLIDPTTSPPPAIPLQVVQATLEMAKFLLSNDLTVGSDVDYLSRVRIDVIELDYQAKTGQAVLPVLINEILFPLGFIQNGGPRFVPIIKT